MLFLASAQELSSLHARQCQILQLPRGDQRHIDAIWQTARDRLFRSAWQANWDGIGGSTQRAMLERLQSAITKTSLRTSLGDAVGFRTSQSSLPDLRDSRRYLIRDGLLDERFSQPRWMQRFHFAKKIRTRRCLLFSDLVIIADAQTLKLVRLLHLHATTQVVIDTNTPDFVEFGIESASNATSVRLAQFGGHEVSRLLAWVEDIRQTIASLNESRSPFQQQSEQQSRDRILDLGVAQTMQSRDAVSLSALHRLNIDEEINTSVAENSMRSASLFKAS